MDSETDSEPEEEEPDADEAPEAKEHSPLQDARLGDFALFQLDPNAPLVLGRIDILDELREYAWVQEYYTYTPGKRQAPTVTREMTSSSSLQNLSRVSQQSKRAWRQNISGRSCSH